jgi:hypothetical protein
MLIKVNILDLSFEFESIAKDLNDVKLHNIVKRTLGKHLKKLNLSLNDFVSQHIELKVCRSCDNIAEYDFKYRVQYNRDCIKYTASSISYPKYEQYEKLYCGKCLKQYNANSIIYVSNIYGVSSEIANEIILKRNKSPFYRTNFDSVEDYKKSQSRSENFYINKYGEIKGKKKYKEHIKKWYESSNSEEHRKKKDSMSLKFHLRKYGKEEGIKQFNNRKLNVLNDLDSLKAKYGELEGIKRYKEKIKKLSYNNTLDGYKERYGELEGIKRYNEWTKKISISQETFILKYGEKEGQERYKKWLVGITSNRKLTYSKESNNFFKTIEGIFPDLTFLYGKNERFIYDKDNNLNGQKIFFYDCYVKELNMLIEYDTPIYHPSPVYLSKEEIEKSRGGSYEKDMYKEKLAKTNNFLFHRIYIKNKKDRIKELEKLEKLINEYK